MSYGAVFRVVGFHPKGDTVSRPYDTLTAARNRAAHLNNEEQRYAEFYNEDHVSRKYEVQVLEGDWESAE